MASNHPPKRLVKSADFEKTKKGRKVGNTPWLFANCCENKDQGLRVGWTVPVYVGNAVIRNRLKRWIKADLRQLSAEVSKISLDVNLVFRRKSEDFYRELKHEVLTDALMGIFRKLPKPRD